MWNADDATHAKGLATSQGGVLHLKRAFIMFLIDGACADNNEVAVVRCDDAASYV